MGRNPEAKLVAALADALAAFPPILYWQPATVGCLHALARLRAAGTSAFGTIDAGPHVVALKWMPPIPINATPDTLVPTVHPVLPEPTCAIQEEAPAQPGIRQP